MKPSNRTFTLTIVISGVLAAVVLYSLAKSKPSHVIRVNGENRGLQTAIDEAKKGMPEFERRLANPKPDEKFAVKGTFYTPQGKEYLWVRAPKLDKGIFSGILDQKPIALVGKKFGDPITVPEKESVDWLIKDSDGMHGAYTEKALLDQQ